MGTFLYHGPCDNCQSRDNKAHYDDGSTFCFGCSKTTPPNHTAKFKQISKRYLDDEDEVEHIFRLPDGMTDELPEQSLDWLKRYGLTDHEIAENYRYWPDKNRHVWHPDVTEPKFIEARSVMPYATPKSLQFGDKIWAIITQFELDTKPGEPICFVEDVVSKIKLQRYVNTVSLFGSNMPSHAVNYIVKLRPSKIFIWLDSDKFREANRMASLLRINTAQVSVVLNPEDPKATPIEKIREFLK